MNTSMKTKQVVCAVGEVLMPIKVGKEICYRRKNVFYWTDRVKRILEVTEDYVKVETISYYYLIKKHEKGDGQMRLAA